MISLDQLGHATNLGGTLQPYQPLNLDCNNQSKVFVTSVLNPKNTN